MDPSAPPDPSGDLADRAADRSAPSAPPLARADFDRFDESGVPLEPPRRSFPAWPAAVVAVVGFGCLLVGIGLSGAVAAGQAPESAAGVARWLTIGGLGLTVIGLVGAAVRSLLVRRRLPLDRYRGPSVILLFLLVLVLGNIMSLPFAEQIAGALLGGDALTAEVAIVVIVITPLAILVITALFVLLPRALAGMRLLDGTKTLRNFLRGLALGLPMWLAAAVVSAIVAVIYQAVTGNQVSEEQAVVGLIGALPLPLALVAAGVLAPMAEELFFRGVVFNAWERERGLRWAVIGSALLFAAVHLFDGAFLVFFPILVIGLVLAIAYRRTRSLPLTFGMHAAFNTISLVLAFFLPGLAQ